MPTPSRSLDTGGAPLLHGDRYRLVLKTAPPVDGFWSLTMYEATDEGQFFLTRNAVGRYAIGDRTPGLVRGPNGEIELWISRDDPGDAHRANWLPAPAQGPFRLSMRAYLPRTELLDGRYRLPPLEEVRPPEPAPAAPEPAPPTPPSPAPRPRQRRRRR